MICIDNQVTNEKVVEKYFLVVKLAQYFVFEEDRKLTAYCKQKNLSFKTRKAVFTNVRFRSWLSKLLSVNAA